MARSIRDPGTVPFGVDLSSGSARDAGSCPYYLIKGKINFAEEIVKSLSGAFALYLYIIYIAYAEEVTAEAERDAKRITMLGMLHKLRQASPMVPSALGASIAAIMIPRVATTLLVVPGLWVLTR